MHIYIYIYILTQSFWTGTKVIRRKHIIQPTGFGACSSTCCQWDGEDVPASWERSSSHPPVRVQNILWQKFIVIILILEEIWGINHRRKAVYLNITGRGPRMALDNISCLLQKTVYQMLKFDCAGVLVSRHIGLQPSPSRLVSANAYFFGVMASQDIHFRDSLPPTDRVSLYKTYIGCICTFLATLMPNLMYNLAFYW